MPDGGIEFVVDLAEFFFQRADIHVIGVMAFENTKDLALNVRVRGTAQGYPDGIVAVFDQQRGKILEKLGQFAVVVIADIEIGENLDKAGADLTQTGLFSLRAVVLDHLHDRCLDCLRRCEENLVFSLLLAAVPVTVFTEEGIRTIGVS